MGAIIVPEHLVAQAMDKAGLSDFGPDGWQVGLEQFLAAVRVDLGDDPDAAAAMQRQALRRLVIRLQIEAWYAEHGHEAAHPVDGPLVIVGLPRTATTALQYLLAVDPQFRYQRRWELSSPVPPPDLATESHDPRRAVASGITSARHIAGVQHIATDDGPIEDGPALALNFGHQELALPLPTYTKWWRTSDLTSTYAYHERVHRLLHSHRPPYLWLLKAPGYLFHLDLIAKQYPNARFLWTHRDPQEAISSTCSVVRTSQQGFAPSHQGDPVELGGFILEHFVEGVRLATAARDSIGEDRFCDVYQTEVENHPMATVERIYDFAGLTLSDDVRAAMTTWTKENRRGARGEHHYAPEDYGLTNEGIQKAFSAYLYRFGDMAGSTDGRSGDGRDPSEGRTDHDDHVRTEPSGQARGRVDPHLPRGRGRVRAAGAAVLRRQGLHRDAAPGGEGVLAGADPVPGDARRHRAQLRRGPRVPRPTVERLGAAADRGVASRTPSMPAGSVERRPGRAANRLQTATLLRAIEENGSRPCSVARAATRRRPAPRSGCSPSATSSASGTRRTSAPSCGRLYNGRHRRGRAHAGLPAVELDRARHLAYIEREGIELPSIYFAHQRAGLRARRHAAMR